MSILPEIILQKAVIRGFSLLKRDPRLVDVLFKNQSQAILSQIKAYLQYPIDFNVNYPRQGQLNLPAIILLLRSESEDDGFLGDVMGLSPFFDTPDPDVVADTVGGHAGSVSDLSGLGQKVAEGLSVTSSSGSTVSIADASLDDFQEIAFIIQQGKGHKLYVVSGTGAGQVRIIQSASFTTLDTTEALDVQLDSTSVVDIREANVSELAEGEPSRVYDPNGIYWRLGANYSVQYQLQILAGHQDGVLYLYSILKALLLSQRPFLESQGIMGFKLSGSDFAPKSEYLPTEGFMRSLNIEFIYPFSFLQEAETASSIQLCLTPEDVVGSGDEVLVGNFTIE